MNYYHRFVASVLMMLLGALAVFAPGALTQTTLANQTVTYRDDFSDPTSGWPRQSPDPAVRQIGYENGEYAVINMAGSRPGIVLSERAAWIEPEIEIEIRLVAPEGDAFVFLGIRYVDGDGDGYYFEVHPNSGELRIYQVLEGRTMLLSSRVELGFVHEGEAANRAAMRLRNHEIILSINGEEVDRVTAETEREGHVVFGAGHEQGRQVEARFDNLVVTGTRVAPPTRTPAPASARRTAQPTNTRPPSTPTPLTSSPPSEPAPRTTPSAQATRAVGQDARMAFLWSQVADPCRGVQESLFRQGLGRGFGNPAVQFMQQNAWSLMLGVLAEIAANPSVAGDSEALTALIDRMVSTRTSQGSAQETLQSIEDAVQRGNAAFARGESVEPGLLLLTGIWSDPAQREAWRFTAQVPMFWSMPQSMQNSMLRRFPEGERTRCSR
jgi:hypothetical protein